METTTLGRTGLRVSRMGLGCGGHSRLGLSYGKSEDEAADLVRRALDLGVNFIDTAESYRTETAVGKGIAGRRHEVAISTKAGVDWQDKPHCTAAEMRERVHACLQRLGVEEIDLFNLHGVRPEEYAYAREELVPELQRLQAEGKIRFLGITEQFLNDTSHKMLDVALEDDVWDVVMVGFSILNQSARQTVLPRTQAKNIGTQCMFAVRRALSRPDALREVVEKLVAEGSVDADALGPDLLDFAFANGIASDLQEAAYRFCRWEPGMDIILSGTGNPEHLRENARSINAPPLPAEVVERLKTIFARVDSVSGN